MADYLLLFVGTVLVNNFVLVKFLGLCPFMGVSKKLETAMGMGLATTFVMTLASICAWLIDTWILIPLDMVYLRTLAFILVIAVVVQFTEMVVRKTSPALYRLLGIFLPLITTNCIVLARAEAFASRNPVLEANFYDVIFLCNTYQYIENRTTYFKSLAGSLKKNGRIVVIDFTKLEKADEESGEVPENLVDKEIVKREFKTAGLKLKRDLKFLPAQYFLEFARE